MIVGIFKDYKDVVSCYYFIFVNGIIIRCFNNIKCMCGKFLWLSLFVIRWCYGYCSVGE